MNKTRFGFGIFLWSLFSLVDYRLLELMGAPEPMWMISFTVITMFIGFWLYVREKKDKKK